MMVVLMAVGKVLEKGSQMAVEMAVLWDMIAVEGSAAMLASPRDSNLA